jgi:hypothetical protein
MVLLQSALALPQDFAQVEPPQGNSHAVVVYPVAQWVVLGVLLLPRLVYGCDDSARFGDGKGVDIFEVAELDLRAHLLLLLHRGLWARD